MTRPKSTFDWGQSVDKSKLLSHLDVVYPVRPSRSGNEELRYSLRTIEKSFPHRDVYVYTSKPIEWLSDNVHVQIVDELPNPNASVNNKLAMACANPNISDPFVMMNDDFFIMRKIQNLPDYCLGLMDSQIAARNQKDIYRGCLVRACNIIRMEYGVEFPLDYEIHAPVLFNKDELSEVCHKHITQIRRSLYFAVADQHLLPKQHLKVPHDCKLYCPREWPFPWRIMTLDKLLESGAPIISTTDRYWTQEFAGYIKPLFNKPSKYEKGEA